MASDLERSTGSATVASAAAVASPFRSPEPGSGASIPSRSPGTGHVTLGLRRDGLSSGVGPGGPVRRTAGVLVIRATGDSASIVNAEDFEPASSPDPGAVRVLGGVDWLFRAGPILAVIEADPRQAGEWSVAPILATVDRFRRPSNPGREPALARPAEPPRCPDSRHRADTGGRPLRRAPDRTDRHDRRGAVCGQVCAHWDVSRCRALVRGPWPARSGARGRRRRSGLGRPVDGAASRPDRPEIRPFATHGPVARPPGRVSKTGLPERQPDHRREAARSRCCDSGTAGPVLSDARGHGRLQQLSPSSRGSRRGPGGASSSREASSA